MLVIAGFNLLSVPLMTLNLWLKAERDQVEAVAKWDAKFGDRARNGEGDTKATNSE